MKARALWTGAVGRDSMKARALWTGAVGRHSQKARAWTGAVGRTQTGSPCSNRS
jgi:hypothetical protein